MADELRIVTIAFKPGPAQTSPTTIGYRMTAEELKRLTDEATAGESRGSYAIQDKDGQPRILFLHFADVLYIG